MPEYRIKDNATGRIITVRGDSPPTQEEALSIIQNMGPEHNIGREGNATAVQNVLGNESVFGFQSKPLNAFLMALGATANDSFKGLQQLAQDETSVFGVTPFTVTPGREEEVAARLDSEAETQALAREIFEKETVAGFAGAGVGFIGADPISLMLGGPAFKIGKLGVQSFSKASRVLGNIAGGTTAGSVAGATAYVDPEAGLTRGEMTGLGAILGGGGTALLHGVAAGFRKAFNKSPEKALLEANDMVDNYENLYNTNLIRFRGNKAKAHASTRKELGINWQSTRHLAEIAERDIPALATNPAEAREALVRNPTVRAMMHPNDIAALEKGDVPAIEAFIEGFKPMVKKGKALNPYQKPLREGEGSDNVLDLAMGAMKTRLRNRSPEVADALTKHDFFVSRQAQVWMDKSNKFFDEVDKLQKRVDPRTWNRWKALLMTDREEALKQAGRLPGTKALREEGAKMSQVLDEIFDSGAEIYGVVGKRPGFFPRRVVQDEKLLKLITDDAAFSHIGKQLKKASTQEEMNKIVNQYVKNPVEITTAKGSTLGHKRAIDFVKTDQAPAYIDPRASFDTYVNEAAHLIGRKRFFDELGVSDPFVRATGESLEPTQLMKALNHLPLGRDDLEEVATILQARFGPGERSMNKTMGGMKDFAHLVLLGDIQSTMVQAQDLYSSFFKNGGMHTIAAVFNKLRGRVLDKEDFLGLKDHVADFASTSDVKKLSDFVLTISGFRKLDKFGKEVFMESALRKNQKLAKTSPEKFHERWKGLFGADTERLRQDLLQYNKPADATDNIGVALWDELSGVQPISISEMPELWAKHPNGRLFYTLQSFTLKQLDIIRRDMYQELVRASQASGKQKQQHLRNAAANLFGYSTFFIGSSMGVDLMKDHLNGREPRDIDVLLLDGALKAVGVNKYTLDKVSTGQDIWGALAGMLSAGIRPFTMAAEAAIRGKPEDFMEFLPVAGRTLKNRIKGSNKEAEFLFGKDDDVFGDELVTESVLGGK